MEFRDLKQQYRNLKSEIDSAIIEVVTDANFIMGKQVHELEEQLSEYVGVKHCVTCANGTDALSLAMMVWDIKKGDAVFIPDFTFFSSGEIVSLVGATPIFVDVDEDTYNIDSIKLEAKIKEVLQDGKLVPRAIVTVDLFGLPANHQVIRQIADNYGLYILEDGAQGFGGRIGDKVACSFGDISTTSFFPTKPLGCYGDGGAVFTDNDEWDRILRSYQVHGKGESKYDNVRIGINSRLDTIQAAILKVKLNAFKNCELNDVNRMAREYTSKLKDVVKTPLVSDGFYSSWAQYTIQLENKGYRDSLQKALKEAGIPSMVYYPKPMHLQKAFDLNECCDGDFPVTNRLCQTVLSLPIHPYLTDDDIGMVIDIIKAM